MRKTFPVPAAGLALAVAATAVNAPRLVLAFLEADGVVLQPALRAGLLGLTGVATGVVLTGGGAYLAHAIGRGRRFRWLLAGFWLLVLTCSTGLTAPMLVASLAHASLSQVLPTVPLRWTWSAVAVFAVELVAAGSMLAHGAGLRHLDEVEELEEELLATARERNQLASELRRLGGRPGETPGLAPGGGSQPADRDGARQSEGDPITGEPDQPAGSPAPMAELGAIPAGEPAPRANLAAEPAGTPAHARLEPAPPAARVSCRNGCGWTGVSAMAENGHQRWCRLREPLPEPDPRDPT